ncbi:MAG: alcohol dehydrogenase catalytic domain-containing protein [Micromonosporaceae bacterium]
MRALTVRPGFHDSLTLSDIPEPQPEEGPLVVEGLAVGLCGTDVEIVDGGYGEAPGGEDRLVIGHENLGRVAQAPDGSGVAAGDLVVGVVRRPDPEPCPACAAPDAAACPLTVDFRISSSGPCRGRRGGGKMALRSPGSTSIAP